MPPSVICATLFGFYKLLTDERIEIHCGSCVPTSPKTFRREVERLSSFVVERLEYRSQHASIRCQRGGEVAGECSVMAGRSQWQISVLTMRAIIFVLFGFDSRNSAIAGNTGSIKITS